MVVGLVKSIHEGVYNYTDGNKNNKEVNSNGIKNNPGFPNNNNSKKYSTKSVIIVSVIILAVILVLFLPVFRSYYLSVVCNHGNTNQFLKEFVLLFLFSFLWVPNVVYCLWKSDNCKRKPKIK